VLIHRVNVRDPPMMNIAAYIVGMQRVGVRRTVAAVTLIACSLMIPPLVRQDLQDLNRIYMLILKHLVNPV